MLDVRVHGLPLNRPRPDERNLHGEVVEVLRPGAQQALHLRTALDLEIADRVRTLDVVVDRLVVQGDPGKVERFATPEAPTRRRRIEVVRALPVRPFSKRYLLDTVFDGRQHPQPEQVDLQEARVGARVLVPLTHLPARHRRRLHWDELDEGPRRDHHPARVL